MKRRSTRVQPEPGSKRKSRKRKLQVSSQVIVSALNYNDMLSTAVSKDQYEAGFKALSDKKGAKSKEVADKVSPCLFSA